MEKFTSDPSSDRLQLKCMQAKKILHKINFRLLCIKLTQNIKNKENLVNTTFNSGFISLKRLVLPRIYHNINKLMNEL